MSFDVFWQMYPRKVGKLDAQRSYEKAIKKTPEHVIRAAVLRLCDTSAGKEERFVPHPATWLNQGRWDDEPMKNGTTFLHPPARQFPEEKLYPARPRATSWANVWVPQSAPHYLDMIERSTRCRDPREFRIEEGGIWVTRKWLHHDDTEPARKRGRA